LYAVAAASPSAAWAVGDSNNDVPLILGWDGLRWQTISLVSSGLGDVKGSVGAVAAISPDNVWIGGFLRRGGQQNLVIHWDGTGWKTVRIPVEGISDVSVVSENDIWAVGGDAFSSPAVLHWDGSRWRRVRGGVPLSGDLDAITALSARNVWVAGTTNRQTNAHIFAEHWDGHRWKFFRTPRVRGTHLSFLNDLAASANAVWTVSLAFFRRDAPLIERYACSR
ncbi:MAG: hypothetical protein M3R37_10225, partial [Actinomycetota bacterium]|nr:hypothetical protein [Actinomycetota bacterium]